MTKAKLFQDIEENLLSWINDNEFSFLKRLSEENRWSEEFSKKALQEYIKFIYLIQVSPEPLTPSDEVDQVWHLHMQYMDQYDEMNSLLKTKVRHGPTKGGSEEKDKFKDWYEKTKTLYFVEFNEIPPEDVWPSHHERFCISPKAFRVNPEYYFIINKKKLTLTIGVICISTSLLSLAFLLA